MLSGAERCDAWVLLGDVRSCDGNVWSGREAWRSAKVKWSGVSHGDVLQRQKGAWCNGSTHDFDSCGEGSNPSAPTIFALCKRAVAIS